MPAFRLSRGGLQDRFLRSKAKVQVIGGGFANGKTSASCIKALQLAEAYPGSNGLIARETRPKLVDTIMKEFTNWCPPEWIKSFPQGVNSSNTCSLVNGSTINFRYIAQQKKGANEGTSNLLSATYDWIIVDQMEDPGIVEKDFDDLLGRLRGNAHYQGDDPSMPPTGPRWFIITLNPTRNWIFRRLVQPLKIYEETGRITDDLLCVRDRDTNAPILDADGKPELLIELFEGATYENAQNLGADYIQTLESTYQGQMKDRFLMGEWAAYYGLIYSAYDETVHSIKPEKILEYYMDLVRNGYSINWLEGYDYGLAVPSCYGLAFVDPHQNVIVCDGFYQAELGYREQAAKIKAIREKWGVVQSHPILADPAIFRRGPGTGGLVGQSVAGLFESEGIKCRRGNNAIVSGISKLQMHWMVKAYHRNPFTYEQTGAHLYHSSDLDWIVKEINEYVWKTDSRGNIDGDVPDGKNDHAMDMLKYLTSFRPEPSVIVTTQSPKPRYTRWNEAPDEVRYTKPQRHGM